jgi:hypothetical protein
MYFCTPVVGIDGTSAFNDAALVFFTLATIELLSEDCAMHAGITAGFSYAIKMTGGLVPGLALVYLIALRRWRAAVLFSIAAGVMIAPWILRNAIEAGNPFAPVLNAWFPNPYFTISGEQALMAWFRQYDIASAWQIPVELTVYGRALHGMLGPVYLLAPVALLALRNKTGRVLLALAAVLTVPWQLNWGTRFLMPAIPFLTAAMVLPLPRVIAMGVLGVHAVTSLPWAIDRYAPQAWHLSGFPVAAALRIESESDYMRRVSWEYNIASMVDAHTRAGDRVLDLYGMQPALAHRVILTDWQSSTGERLRAALQIAQNPTPGVFVEYRSDVPPGLYAGVRVRQAAAPSNWSVQEIELWNGSDRVPSGRKWSLSAWPNEWFAPSAFDVNWASSWATWQHAEPGMYVEADFNEPVTLTSVNVVGLGEERDSRPEVFVERRDGGWFRVDARRSVHTGVNLHRNATKLVTRSGIRYLLVPTGKDGNGPLGVSMSETPADWGVEKIANFQHIYLMRIQ